MAYQITTNQLLSFLTEDRDQRAHTLGLYTQSGISLVKSETTRLLSQSSYLAMQPGFSISTVFSLVDWTVIDAQLRALSIPNVTRDPFVSQVYADDPTIFWAPITPQPLVAMQNGQTTAVYNPAAAALLSSGNYCIQEILPGLPMRVWLDGSGGPAGTDIDPISLAQANAEKREDQDILRPPRLASTTLALSKMFVRLGNDRGWDQPAPFLANSFPSIDPHSTLHGRDPVEQARIAAASELARLWARTFSTISANAPIIMDGIITGGGTITATLGQSSVATSYVIHEMMEVGINHRMGPMEIKSFEVPSAMLLNISMSSADDLQRAIWSWTTPRFPNQSVHIAGILIRPLNGDDKRRFYLDRSTIHPYFRSARGS